MLDDSGSMSGSFWNDLIKGFTKFINKLHDDENLKKNSWISVINYNETFNT